MNRGQWEEIKTQIEVVANLSQQRGVLTLSNEISPRKSTTTKLNTVIADERNAITILKNLIREVAGEPQRPTREPNVRDAANKSELFVESDAGKKVASAINQGEENYRRDVLGQGN